MSGGMDNLYNEFQNVPNVNQKEMEIEKILDKTITVPKIDKGINLITDIPDSYSIVVMESLEDYFLRKYGVVKEDRKYVKIMVSPIHNFTTRFKQLNPSVLGKRVAGLYGAVSRIVEAIRSRSNIQRLTGVSDKGE